MELGSKIKQLRNQKGLTQEELANRCELTKGYISQLENDLTSPSITTLTDILLALGSNLAEFFKEETLEKTVFQREELFEKDYGDVFYTWLVPNAQKNMMEPVLVRLAPKKETEEDIPHEGEEFGYVLDGEIAIVLGKKKSIAKKGDSFYYNAGKTHKIVNVGNSEAKFVWVSTPPNF